MSSSSNPAGSTRISAAGKGRVGQAWRLVREQQEPEQRLVQVRQLERQEQEQLRRNRRFLLR